MKKKKQEWMPTYMAVGGLVGMMIGLGFVYMFTGTFSIGTMLGGLTAMVITIGYNVVKVKAKKDKTPEMDERTRQNMIKFYAYFSHAFLGLLFILLGIVSFMDIKNISIAYLWIVIIVYFLTSGIGGMLVKRR